MHTGAALVWAAGSSCSMCRLEQLQYVETEAAVVCLAGSSCIEDTRKQLLYGQLEAAVEREAGTSCSMAFGGRCSIGSR